MFTAQSQKYSPCSVFPVQPSEGKLSQKKDLHSHLSVKYKNLLEDIEPEAAEAESRSQPRYFSHPSLL